MGEQHFEDCCEEPDPEWENIFRQTSNIAVQKGECRTCGSRLKAKWKRLRIREM